MIKEICFKLREKRKELGYTLEEAVEKTKLHPSVIRDIEDGNLDNINPTYLKGFIKIYAAFLDVDAQEALGELSVPQAPKVQRKIRKEESYVTKIAKFTKIKKPIPPKVKQFIVFSLLGIVLFFMLISAGRFVVKKISSVVRRPPKKEKKTQIKPITPQFSSDEIAVSLTAKRDCFLRVKVDKKVLFEGILKKGAVETWKAEKVIEFKISDGSSVYIEVNGTPLPPLTSMRKPIKSLKITPSGVSVDK
ncbi:MAG: DUF4115 domain-containing protein [Candidatus Omnitrophota bacterium]|nr:MAG: DUF4115 domain-containing protein [Candidatus Omnitrophota bacterium]